MKSKLANNITLMSLLSLAACFGGSGGVGVGGAIGTINPNLISGVAATGAPISNGKVKIKGSDGEEVETTTSSDGSYSANVGNLAEPILVKVIALSGEKYISVATKSALAEGKKINVTPISHIIVSNVFETKDPDELFSNFQSKATNFDKEDLDSEKDELKRKFQDAGLIGTNGVVSNDVDLLNGNLAAGTSQGLDGLLDVIEVNTGSNDGIEVKLKVGDSGVPLFVDKVIAGQTDGPTTNATSSIAQAKKQLGMIDIARQFLVNFASIYSQYAGCSGDPNSQNYQCDIDEIYHTFEPHFDDDFQENGNTSKWGWICDEDIQHKEDCTKVEFGWILMKDVSLVSYNSATKVAIVTFNIYENGVLGETSEIALKATESNGEVTGFKILGNQKSFRYWVNTSSEHLTESVLENNQINLQNKYQVNLNFYLDKPGSHTFSGGEQFTLTALSGNLIFNNGTSNSMPLYLVKFPNRESSAGCVNALAFSVTDKAYQEGWDSTLNKFNEKTYDEVCPNDPNPCDCTNLNFNYESSRLILSEDQVNKMSKIERISLSLASKNISDEFIIKKPMVINQYSASSYVPTLSITPTQFCENTSPVMPLNISTPNGVLNYLSLYYSTSGYDSNNIFRWFSENSEQNYWDDGLSNATFSPNFAEIPSNSEVQFRYLYLESRNDDEQTFVRRINCSTM